MGRVYNLMASVMVVVALLLSGCTSPMAQDTSSVTQTVDGGVVVGIAWWADTDSQFCVNVLRSFEAAGATCVVLDEAISADLAYDDGKLAEGIADTGALEVDTARIVRDASWYASNAAEVVGDVDLVVFTGGADVSPSLYLDPQEWHGIEEERDYDAERDVSDYLTMSWCLDHDVPVLGICRGMQMLSVLSGATVIQDLPTFFADEGVNYTHRHRREATDEDARHDYSSHEIYISKDSLLFDLIGIDVLQGCPSWHH